MGCLNSTPGFPSHRKGGSLAMHDPQLLRQLNGVLPAEQAAAAPFRLVAERLERPRAVAWVADHASSADWQVRRARLAGKVTKSVLVLVAAKLRPLLEM